MFYILWYVRTHLWVGVMQNWLKVSILIVVCIFSQNLLRLFMSACVYLSKGVSAHAMAHVCPTSCVEVRGPTTYETFLLHSVFQEQNSGLQAWLCVLSWPILLALFSDFFFPMQTGSHCVSIAFAGCPWAQEDEMCIPPHVGHIKTYLFTILKAVGSGRMDPVNETKVSCNSLLYSEPQTVYLLRVKKGHIGKVVMRSSYMQSQVIYKDKPHMGKEVYKV